MAKINMYEASISERNSANFFLNSVDEILKFVSLLVCVNIIAKLLHVPRGSKEGNFIIIQLRESKLLVLRL